MPNAYLTIDDAPSSAADALLDGLIARDIPAILYCRGDYLEHDMAPMVRAVQHGMVLANHSYTHKQAGELGYEAVCQGILRTDALIDECYARAGCNRPGKYFRFPYIDRGDGDRIERRFFDLIKTVEQGGTPDIPENETVRALQTFLASHGFTQPFKGVTHPLYAVPAIRDARDCLFTYSTGDWMLNARHKGTQALQSVSDLTAALDADPYVLHEGGSQVILIHDQPEITASVLALLDHMLARGISFLKV